MPPTKKMDAYFKVSFPSLWGSFNEFSRHFRAIYAKVCCLRRLIRFLFSCKLRSWLTYLTYEVLRPQSLELSGKTCLNILQSLISLRLHTNWVFSTEKNGILLGLNTAINFPNKLPYLKCVIRAFANHVEMHILFALFGMGTRRVLYVIHGIKCQCTDVWPLRTS